MMKVMSSALIACLRLERLRLLSESLRVAKERGSSATVDGDFGYDLEAVVSSHGQPLTPPAWE
jgi:hypothetical protein